jgi:radical SAM superfamily enzyme YgiQ (UPF0313 family)
VKIRLVEAPLAVPRYRQVRLPTVAAEFAPFADVEINDPNIEDLDESRVDLVGFTAQAYNAPRAIHLSRRFRERGIKTIVGGPYPTTARDGALEHFDAAVVGEVEGLGERIVRDLERGELGGLYRSETPPDLASCRQPRRDLQKGRRYYHINYPMEFSRGCPHRCHFCYGPHAFPTFRTRPLDDIAADLDRWDYGYIEAVDLHVAGDRKHLIEVCRLLEERKVWGWYSEATLSSMDNPQVLEALARSNCKMMFVGIESIEEAALAASNKQFNKVADFKRIIRAMQDHGIFVHAGLMWGLDGASKDSFEDTARFCEDVGMYLASTNIVAFFPGLPAHDEMEQQGRLVVNDMRDYDSCRVIIEPQGMTTEEVYAGARRFLDRFYSYRSIFKRSFQATNYRLAQVYDFWGLNLVYRAYFKEWGRRLGATDTPWPAAPEERDSFPYVGGQMPPIYAIGHWEGRFFDRVYRAWERVPGATSAVGTLAAAGIVAVLSVVGLGLVGIAEAARWPVPWPATWAVLPVFAAATGISTWLVGRLARAPRGQLASAVGLGLVAAPMVAATLALPDHAGLWRFLCAWATAIFALKAWSVLASREAQRPSGPRVASFLLQYPTLDFDGAYRLDPTKKMLTRHYPLMMVGTARFLVGLVLLPVLLLLGFSGWIDGALEVAGFLGQILVIYLLLRGGLEYWTAYWRLVGYRVPRPFRPGSLGPAAPSSLWRRWNTPYQAWLRRHVYIPLGGRDRPVLATLGTFLVSGAILELALAPAVGHLPVEVVLFFLAQGAVVALEKKFVPRGSTTWISWLLYGVAAALLLAATPWLSPLISRIVL